MLLSGSLPFIPHGHCYLWRPALVAMHGISDSLIAIAYYIIPLGLMYFVRRRSDLPYPIVFWLFSAFIVACGTTHLLEVWTLWHPHYWLSGGVKALTAVISLFTAGTLGPLLSQVIALPSAARLQEMNQTLQQEISDRQRAEATLRRYERIVSAVTDGICLLDRQGIYQIANQAYLDWHQKADDAVIGQPISNVLNPSLLEQKVQPYFDLCLNGEKAQLELWVDHPVFARQFISVSYAPYTELDGTISGVIIDLRNLTHLKQIELALHSSEATQRAILEGIPDLLIHLDRHGRRLNLLSGGEIQIHPLTQVNRCQSIYDTLPPELADLRMQYVHQALTTGQRQVYEHVIDLNGDRRHEETRVVKLNDQEVLLMVRDITEHKQAQQQIELQAVITRNMAGGICLVNADDGIIVYANPKFEQMFGYDPGELTGKHVSIVNYATEELSAEAVNQSIRAAVLAHQEATYEVHNVKKDGTPFWCRATTSVFEHPTYGKVLVAVQQDISEQKKAEDQLRASLEEKELLLKEIYHRVKNNLQVIYSLLNLQSRHLKDSSALAALKDSQSRVRAMALVHEKLYQSHSLSRIDFADYVTSLSHSLLEFYKAGSSAPNLTLNLASFWLDIETAIPCGLILTELISNALKHAFPEGLKGELEIALTRSSADQVSLSVQDNGVGMASDLDLKTMPSLGLKLVRNLAQQIKGGVTLVSQPQGTHFLITFPI